MVVVLHILLHTAQVTIDEVSDDGLRWFDSFSGKCVAVRTHSVCNVISFINVTDNAIGSVFLLRVSKLFCNSLSYS